MINIHKSIDFGLLKFTEYTNILLPSKIYNPIRVYYISLMIINVLIYIS